MVEQIERNECYQPRKGDKAPAFGFHSLNQPFKPGTSFPPDPVCR